MASSLSELTAPKTADDLKAALISALPAGFQPDPSTWRDGDVVKTLVEIDAQSVADVAALIPELARGGFVTTQPGVTGADGAWLDLAAGWYGLTRNAAIAAMGTSTLADAGGAGPFTITSGQLWMTTAAGLRFSNAGGGTLSQGGTLSLTWAAESPGADHNAANGAAMTLVTPLPGVTCSPLAITTQGTDAESDVALATRCQGRWSALGTGSPKQAYDLWARTASAEVTHTLVQASGAVPGQIDVFLRGTNGPVSSDAVAAVQAALGPAVVPMCSTALAQNATAQTIAVAGTVYVASSFLSAVPGPALANLNALFGSIDIGAPVYLSAVIEQIMAPAGVRNCAVTLNGGTNDIVLGATQVAVLNTLGLSFVGV